MKICIVALGLVPYYHSSRCTLYGGAEVQAAFLARALNGAGQDVSLVVSDLGSGDALPHEAYNAYDSDRGVRIVRTIHPRLTGLVSALARADADLYYQRNAGVPTGVTGMFCRARGRKFVYGAGGDTDLAFRTARIDGFRDRTLYYLGLRAASGIVVQNRYQEALCQRGLNKPVRVISNGVDIAPLEPRARDRIVWIGAIRRVKQPELLLELARQVPSRQFVMIGGPSVSERRFAAEIADAAADVPNLRLTGHLAPAEVKAQLSRAVALVNTSRVEGFPNAYLEAWSQGVPVIAFRDLDGLIETERVGHVCCSVEEMAAAISALASGDAREEMGRAARRLVERRFSPDVIARQYLEFFAGL